MSEHLIVRVIVKLLVPFILLFALYVQMHGDYGPGGGFQAGVIFATGFIVYSIAFGARQTIRVLPLSVVTAMVSLGVVLYALVGFVTVGAGGNFLDYGVLDSHDPVHGQHLGILLIELGVGISVAGVLTAIFFTFAERRQK
ncbi:MAG: Na(+)/H(+) antiporter subunit B [Alphaproteobacteria bacterium]|jgi:multicomponent Na+:H+ antiporter subunit B|nr:Na(+)/H(+) antiporter subunit B [Rhodospirillaceae bacterium]MBT6204553.1 Na(+)/H(+) antiporter subunit B [Rhodospirillaceae bacterium]MBT7614463.1 Na(+)/H(+) antiporter subunit B [Rhodospirillaceae bacterium]MBT7645634.1 Na(+)/H(+) antiporter subunit B [Rhodospirillaceae bacterium]MDG2481850.1 Na(+)/H(+) antiporter subunit B [Alphaproteobacteria bacterium]